VGGLGWQELLIIFVILLLLFGATRLPALSKSLGQSIRGFKKGMEGDEPAEGEKPAVADKDKTPDA
jgi:sec-independent protein translocase protein TatA